MFASFFGVFAIINLFQGMWQLHHALNPRAKKTAVPTTNKFTARADQGIAGRRAAPRSLKAQLNC